MTDYRRVGELQSVIRGRAGTTVLQFSMVNWTKSAFRIYDRNWRPQTPLLRINARLEMLGPVPGGFIAVAATQTREQATTGRTTDRWVIVNRAGRLRETAGQPRRGDRPRRLRAADVPLSESPPPDRFAYRPSHDAVFIPQMPPWYRPYATWFRDPDETVCTFDKITPRVGDNLRTSTDAGRTWRAVPTVALSPSTGPLLQWCAATRDQVTVTTGDEEYPLWVHTLDRRTGALIASHQLGYSLDPYNLQVLADGTLIAHTNRPGLMVGATPRNYSMVFRPGPRQNDVTFVVGRDLIAISLGWPQALKASRDAAKTWVRHDLAMPR